MVKIDVESPITKTWWVLVAVGEIFTFAGAFWITGAFLILGAGMKGLQGSALGIIMLLAGAPLLYEAMKNKGGLGV